jgi:hypothetical protein
VCAGLQSAVLAHSGAVVMPDALPLLHNRTRTLLGRPGEGNTRPAWVIATLASILIFTTVVDVLGNLLVIVSVFRNRKLRNSGKSVCFSHRKQSTD